MAKEVTPRQKRIRKRARRLARGAGKDWKTLPKEARRPFLREARSAVAGKGGKKPVNPLRDRAKKAAKDAGLNWQELSPEQRRTFVRKARRNAE